MGKSISEKKRIIFYHLIWKVEVGIKTRLDITFIFSVFVAYFWECPKMFSDFLRRSKIKSYGYFFYNKYVNLFTRTDLLIESKVDFSKENILGTTWSYILLHNKLHNNKFYGPMAEYQGFLNVLWGHLDLHFWMFSKKRLPRTSRLEIVDVSKGKIVADLPTENQGFF